MIDTHCHLDAEELAIDRDDILARCRLAGVKAIVVPAYVADYFERLLDVCSKTAKPRLFPALGLHPCYLQQHDVAALTALQDSLERHPQIIAVGEIGLDRFVENLRGDEAMKAQAGLLHEQLALAERFAKPVLLHVRKAHQEVLGILTQRRFRQGGIVHAFSGGIEEAKRYLRLGFRLGIGGTITYDQARRLRAVVAELPLSALVLETDSPDMIPRQYRQTVQGSLRNVPYYLDAVVSSLAELKQCSEEDVMTATTREACATLRITDF